MFKIIYLPTAQIVEASVLCPDSIRFYPKHFFENCIKNKQFYCNEDGIVSFSIHYTNKNYDYDNRFTIVPKHLLDVIEI